MVKKIVWKRPKINVEAAEDDPVKISLFTYVMIDGDVKLLFEGMTQRFRSQRCEEFFDWESSIHRDQRCHVNPDVSIN